MTEEKEGEDVPEEGEEGERESQYRHQQETRTPPPPPPPPAEQENDEEETRRAAWSMCRHNRMEELKSLLLAKSVSLDVAAREWRDQYGSSLLHVATQNGLKRMSKMLLRNVCNWE